MYLVSLATNIQYYTYEYDTQCVYHYIGTVD